MNKVIRRPLLLINLVCSALASPIIMLLFYLGNPMFFYVAIALLPILTLPTTIWFFACVIIFFWEEKNSILLNTTFLICNILLLLWSLTYAILGLMNMTYSSLFVISLVCALLHLSAVIKLIIKFIIKRYIEKKQK